MSKKEFIDEVVVSDRTSPMTNPMTKDSLKSAEAVGEGALQEARPSVVVVPKKKTTLLQSGKNGVSSSHLPSR